MQVGDEVVCVEPGHNSGIELGGRYTLERMAQEFVGLKGHESYYFAYRFELATKKPPKGANAEQVGGSHYQGTSIQPWDFIIANQLGFLEGSIIKYVARFKRKGGLEDLQKAKHFLDKLIEETE